MPELGDPQALNRYNFSANNPLKYIDPIAHIFYFEGAGDSGSSQPLPRRTSRRLAASVGQAASIEYMATLLVADP